MNKDFPLHRVNFKFHQYIFTGAIGKLEATKLVMKQSASFPQFVPEGTQISIA